MNVFRVFIWQILDFYRNTKKKTCPSSKDPICVNVQKIELFLMFLHLLVTENLNTLASKVANSHTLFSLTLFIFYLDNLILHHYILLKWNSLKLEFQLSSFCFLNFSFLLHWQGGKFANKFSTAILIFTFGGMYFTALPGPHTYSIDGFQRKYSPYLETTH